MIQLLGLETSTAIERLTSEGVIGSPIGHSGLSLGGSAHIHATRSPATLSPQGVTCSRRRICDPARRHKFRVESTNQGWFSRSPVVRLSGGGSSAVDGHGAALQA